MLKVILSKLLWLFFWSLSGIGVLLLQALYYRVPWVNLFINSWKWRLLNRSMYWSVTVEYKGEFPSNVLVDVPNMIKSEFDRYKFRSKSNEKILFEVEGFLVTIELYNPTSLFLENGLYPTLYISVSNIRTPFREAERLLNRLTTILMEVEKHLTLQNAKYGTTVEFEKTNPYFGLYARKLRAGDIENFLCVFHVHHIKQADGTVQISKQSIDVTSQQILAFQEITNKYLALSAV